jgi:hypothetical protein
LKTHGAIRSRITRGCGMKKEAGIICLPTRGDRSLSEPVQEIIPLAADEILGIAYRDAIRAYRDLTPYRLTMFLEQDGWHVDFELKDSGAVGGGPHYIIDPQSAEIVHKRYEQ